MNDSLGIGGITLLITSNFSHSMMKRFALLTAAVALAPALSLAAPRTNAVNPVLAERNETAAQHDTRMEWFRDAHFGMFIHWGLYAQAGGEWDGKQGKYPNGSAEWLMSGSKIPIADYAKLAKDFNPTHFDAEKWVAAAQNAGVRYIVITAKHHEGFAMFATKVSPFNIVDATPFKRDPLKELAAACKKHGMKLGFYYSQNLDWHHPGGGSGDWDPTHKGDPEKYVNDIVVPQLKEILTHYGEISVLWFDIPGGVINKERADRIQKTVLACNPKIIMNNRLGGGYHGDIETPEQHIPATGFPGRDWESCMTMNGTWGFSKTDHNWKSTTTLIHNLCDITSKNGNYLLNVGPNELGEIPTPSLERLVEIGAWMKVNGEAIHDVRGGIFSQLPNWGRITARANSDGTTTLYAIVYASPQDGVLSFPGLTNTARNAKVLGSGMSVKTASDGYCLFATIPEAQYTAKDFVVAITLEGMIAIDSATQADDTGAFSLSPRLAEVSNGLLFEGGGASGLSAGTEEHLGFWIDNAGAASWHLKSKTAGTFTLAASFSAPAASAGSIIEFVCGDQVLPFEIKSTGDWKKFVTATVGTLKLPAGPSTVSVRIKTRNGLAPCNLGKITLTPMK